MLRVTTSVGTLRVTCYMLRLQSRHQDDGRHLTYYVLQLLSGPCVLGPFTYERTRRPSHIRHRFLRHARFLFQVSSTQLLLYSFHLSPLLLCSFHLSSLLLYSFHLFSDIALYLPLIPWYLENFSECYIGIIFSGT